MGVLLISMVHIVLAVGACGVVRTFVFFFPYISCLPPTLWEMARYHID